MNLLLLNLMMAVAPAPAAPANAPVPTLELARYAGEWHEVAHLPMFFQRKCVDQTTARYTLLPDGEIEVRNACRDAKGGRMESVGRARAVPGVAGALKVRFAPAWLDWVPGVWADYWVIELDPEYRWAVVGGPSRKYLWILSREPGMDRALFDRLRNGARDRGYPVERLVMAAKLR